MSKGSRIDDLLQHDIPLYPLSSTPDGRMTGEIHRGRNENKAFHERSLTLQEQTLKTLEQQHGGNVIVQPDQFSRQETLQALGHMAEGIQGLYTAQTRGHEELASISSQGFQNLQEGLERIKGPIPEKKFLEDIVHDPHDIISILNLYGKGVLNGEGRKEAIKLVDKVLQDYRLKASSEKNEVVAKMRENGYNTESIASFTHAFSFLCTTNNILGSPEDAHNSANIVYRIVMKLNAYGVLAFIQRVKELLQLYISSMNESIAEELLIDLCNSGYLVGPIQSKLMKDYPEARQDPSIASMTYHLGDILKSSKVAEIQRYSLLSQGEHAVGQRDEIIGVSREIAAQGVVAQAQRDRLISLSEVAHGQRNQLIEQGSMGITQRKEMLKQGEEMLEQGVASIDQRNCLIEQGEIQIELHNTLVGQGEVGEGQRSIRISQGEKNIELNEVRVRQGFVQIGYSAIAVEQRRKTVKEQRLTNYRLDLILDQLITNEELAIDLRNIVRSFGALITNALRGISDDMREHSDAIRSEIVLSRVAMMRQLHRIEGAEIQTRLQMGSELAKGNGLLKSLVDLTSGNHSNKARQYFEDGRACLESAETEEDIKDAHKQFCRGADKVKTSIENHFGAGFTAELLGDFKKAKLHYRKGGRRASQEQADLGSQSFEYLASIYAKEGNIAEAIKAIQNAIRFTPQKHELHYKLAKYFLLSGETQKSLNTMKSLIEMEESFFCVMQKDVVFYTLPISETDIFLEELWKEKLILSPKSLITLFTTLAKIRPEVASEVFYYLLKIAPHEILKGKVWQSASFARVWPHISKKVEEFVEKELLRATLENCYVLLVLFYKLRVDNSICYLALRAGMSQEMGLKQIGKIRAKKMIHERVKEAVGIEVPELWTKLKDNSPSDLKWLFL